MTDDYQHKPVLLSEVIEGLAIKADGIYIDATLGRGGHSQAILERLGNEGRLIILDKDPQAIAIAEKKWATDKRISIEHLTFSQIGEVAASHQLNGKVSGILLDLGVSSPQLDDPARGFSFLKEGPLDMRMDPTQGMSVAEWLEKADETEVANVLWEYGEERYSRRIGRAIVRARELEPIHTTVKLAEIIAAAHPAWEKGKHPATRSFQGMRIFINQELTELKTCLAQCREILAVGGRLAVISFHSLEDRIVKHFFREENKGEELLSYLPLPLDYEAPWIRCVGRAIKPTEEEVSINPRARSARLRIAEKIR
jgi:16S rRNA (cytosine1402-N4)-methyltransferase